MAITNGSFLFGFDTGIISGALLFIREDFGLNSFEQSSVVSGSLLGAILGPILGALTGGRIADRYGRRPLPAGLGVLFLIGVVDVVVTVVTVVTVVSTNLVDRARRRLLLLCSPVGRGISIALLGVAFVAKWVPETRGRHADEVGEDLRRRWHAPAT